MGLSEDMAKNPPYVWIFHVLETTEETLPFILGYYTNDITENKISSQLRTTGWSIIKTLKTSIYFAYESRNLYVLRCE